MSQLSISVALCTYNGSRYLEAQLKSIASQLHLPDELVVCDDGSRDDTVSLLTAFALQAPFKVCVVSNEERLGPSKNFEKAIQLCSGDIIALADQDDIWKPNKLGRLVLALEEHPSAVFAFSDADMGNHEGSLLGYSFWDAVGLRKVIAQFSGSGQLSILLRHNLIPGAAMAFRRNFRDIVVPVPAGWMHDYWIVLLGSTLASGVPVSESLFMYRRHAEQTLGWRKKTFLEVCKASLMVGQEESWDKVKQFQKLLDRVQSVSALMQCSVENKNLLKQKEMHLLMRAEIRSTKGISRVLKVVAELITGRYRRFSNNWQSIIRDLCGGRSIVHANRAFK